MSKEVRVLIPEKAVEGRIQEIADRISEEYSGEAVHLICILKGSVFFTCALAQRITVPVTIDFMKVSSYGDGVSSSGVVRIAKDTDETLENKNVIVIEDIIDSGYTMDRLIHQLLGLGASQVKVCSLLRKPKAQRVANLQIDYCCFEIPNDFIVGYGLDYNEQGRNLPYIWVVSPD